MRDMKIRNRKIRQPVTSGHVKVPVIMQMEALECGAASPRDYAPDDQARGWYRDAMGPILAFRKEDGRAVALLPAPFAGYR